jgi:putative transposase
LLYVLGRISTADRLPLLVPRRPRHEFESGVHHVFARGNNRQAVFLDDADRKRYLSALGRVASWTRWRCLSYCLMTNHVHLLLETRTPNLGSGMQRLQGSYAQIFNRRHGRTGHVFQGRFGAIRIEDDQQLWSTLGYIVLNPVRAGLCDRPADWPWSSHAAVIAGTTPTWFDDERLLLYLAGHGGTPAARYAEVIQGRIAT